jgi:exopolysaccharide biosynthesis protein
MASTLLPDTNRRAAEPYLVRERRMLDDGAATTLHVARFPRHAFGLRVVSISPLQTVLGWCRENGAEHAVVGGFYWRQTERALGDVWVDGEAVDSEPIDAPWGERRACVRVAGDAVSVLARHEVDCAPSGDLLQAGPMLVARGRPLVHDGVDSEGFAAGSRQFDSDITAGRYPRAAFGLNASELVAVACEGRADGEAGLTMRELAEAMAGLGCESAINLDGGGSTTLVYGGSLANIPREEHGLSLAGGRAVATALRFVPLAQPPAAG